MIILEDDRNYVSYYRTNRRCKWKYAEYAGRWETIEKAIQKIKDKVGDTPVEYRIEDMFDDDKIVAIGFINWPGRE